MHLKKTKQKILWQKNKQGQAALEYIVTYGWGFVVILVVLGGLAYFGYLNPTRYVPSRCSFGVQLECIDYKLEAKNTIGTADNGNITLVLRNNFDADINVTMTQLANGYNPKSAGPSNKPVQIIRGASATISTTLTDPLSPILIEKERISIPMTITFQRDSGGPLHNVTGEIFATIQKRN